MNENIFSLSKREQRAAIAIVLALLVGTFVAHYRNLRTEIRAPAPATVPAPPEEPDESP